MPANAAPVRLTGAIEGFYGRPWAPAERLQLVSDLAELCLDAYLYAPKADAHLRRRWAEPWPAAEAASLAQLSKHCRDAGVAFGLGLSPFRLYADYGPAARRTLQARIRQLDDLGATLLAVLFDDMPGDTAELAARQAEIVADVAAWSRAGRLLVCPTYYSDDPVLDRVFGQRPAGYREALGAELPESVDIFWTGRTVCATAIAEAEGQARVAAVPRELRQQRGLRRRPRFCPAPTQVRVGLRRVEVGVEAELGEIGDELQPLCRRPGPAIESLDGPGQANRCGVSRHGDWQALSL
jgi:hypothetical protein